MKPYPNGEHRGIWHHYLPMRGQNSDLIDLNLLASHRNNPHNLPKGPTTEDLGEIAFDLPAEISDIGDETKSLEVQLIPAGQAMSTNQEQAEQVVQNIHAFYSLGKRSLAARDGRGTHGSGAIEAEAKREGVSAEHLRKARAFADEKTGYKSRQLDALCRDVRNHFDKFSRRNHLFSTSHCIRLLSVPKAAGEKGREQVQKRLFAAGWSVAELDAEIRRLHGRRRRGGRQKRVGDGSELLSRLEEFATSWSRWYQRMNPQDDDPDVRPISKLPTDVRELVTRVGRVIAQLHAAVEKAIKAAPSTKPAGTSAR